VAVADWIMPHLVHRPLTLVRCPQGRQAKCFYQKHVTESVPAPVRGIEVQERDGPGIYVAVDDLAGLITLVQLSCLEIHPWGSREDKIDYPDRMIFDLDPGEGVTWSEMITAAREMRLRMSDLGLESFLRTTGGKGLHLVVPLVRRTPWDEVKEFARSVASAFVRLHPEGFVDTMSKEKRRGKIYIDYLRNDRGSTAIASYSTRARPGATVATPIHWEELTARLKPERLTIKTVPKRLRGLDSDPWKDYFDVQQSVSKSMLKGVRGW
jgi:bifunctional non-homologous end joining protein LigD